MECSVDLRRLPGRPRVADLSAGQASFANRDICVRATAGGRAAELLLEKWRASWKVVGHFVSLEGTIAARDVSERRPRGGHQMMNTMTKSCCYKMGALVVLTFVLIARIPYVQSQSEPAPVVSRVYWITLHARSLEAFDSLYDLLNQKLQLPVFFPPENTGTTLRGSAGGRRHPRTVRPLADSRYRSVSVLAPRWNTLIFRPHRHAESIASLGDRNEHGSPQTEMWDGKQVNVNVTGLSTPGMPVMLGECVEGERCSAPN